MSNPHQPSDPLSSSGPPSSSDPSSSSEPRSRLDDISTRWSVVGDPLKFVMRYGPAIQKYLHALMESSHDADDVGQDFFTTAIRRGFTAPISGGGRFRKYLKAAIRNAALDFYRRQQAASRMHSRYAERLAEQDDNSPADALDDGWTDNWRNCLLEFAWSRLRQESEGAAAPYYLVLKTATEFPREKSPEQAERVAAATGRPLRADAFRKQLSRARRMFAEYLVDEVSKTLVDKSTTAVEEELRDLGLLDFVRDSLPEE